MSTVLSEPGVGPSAARSHLIIREVELALGIEGGGKYKLSLDPGQVDPIFFSYPAFAIYEHGLGKRLQLKDVAFDDLRTDSQHKSAFEVTADPAASGGQVFGQIVFRNRQDQWFKVSDRTVCESATIIYESHKQPGTFCEVVLPLKPAPQLIPGVDVVFWSAKHRDIYRVGMEGFGYTVRALEFANAQGNYAANQQGYSGVPYPPQPSRQPKFHSTTDELCYHFENCAWSCMVE